MKTKLILFVSSVLFCLHTSSAQKISFGPNIGLINQGKVGSVLLDSVQVELQGGGGLSGYFGGYVAYNINQILSLNTGLNYYQDNLSYVVYNTRTDCQLCPVIKAGAVYYTSFELPILVEIKPPLKESKFFAIAGIAPSLRLKRKSDPYFYHRDAGQGVSDVLPAMKTTVKPIAWDYSLGGGINLGKVRLEMRYQRNLTSSATNPINVWGRKYAFETSQGNIRLGVGYNLYRKESE